jgi:hypothetical protein
MGQTDVLRGLRTLFLTIKYPARAMVKLTAKISIPLKGLSCSMLRFCPEREMRKSGFDGSFPKKLSDGPAAARSGVKVNTNPKITASIT